MINSQYKTIVLDYFSYCKSRKNLDSKTIKSYRIDLNQYEVFCNECQLNWLEKSTVEKYIEVLHSKYKPKSVKRKIASMKAFYHYLELEDVIEVNPFHKIQLRYKEPFILPKTIPIDNIESILRYAYAQLKIADTSYSKMVALRNTLIIELLFATGMRISELCFLTLEQINFSDYIIKISGKGSRERLIQICNENVQCLMTEYRDKYLSNADNTDYIFTNRLHNRLSDQSVRNMLSNYAKGANVAQHITPHMFRHSFATLLLEEDVDIRYIQQMLGHSSITTTQIYTHTSTKKQKAILTAKHPRNAIKLNL